MLAKIVLTLILVIGVIKPELSIRMFEFWKLGRGPISDKTLKITRIFSVVAIGLVWIFLK